MLARKTSLPATTSRRTSEPDLSWRAMVPASAVEKMQYWSPRHSKAGFLSRRIVALLGVGLPTIATRRFRRSTSREKEPVGPAGVALRHTPTIEQSAYGPAPRPTPHGSGRDRTA